MRRDTGHPGPVAFKVGDVHEGVLLRFMAKTAHAFAIAKLGLNAFRPLLTEIILRESSARQISPSVLAT